MRQGALTGARAVLLAGATVLAFFSGGYFDGPRVWAGLLAWVLVAVALIASPALIPRGRAPWLAITGLSLFAVWTLLSFTWAPVAGLAYHAGQLVVLYAGVLLGAAMLLREPGVQRAVEPALAAGALLVIGYGLSERLLPGVLHFQRSISAEGRLEQPLTYWNAMGELAALGFVLCARLAGDTGRARWLRVAAAVAAAPLGMGLYLSFSRGALFACVAGLLTLVVMMPRREQLQGALVSVASAGLAVAASAPFRGVTALAGSSATRERQGAITLALLILVMAGIAYVHWRLLRNEHPGELRLPRRAPVIALGLICAGLALAIVVGAKESSGRPLSAGATRYTTLESNRYAYWRVALRAFGDEPLRGVGAGGWAVYWLRLRPFNEFAQDAHSLPLQTLAELGLVGIALLAAFVAGVGWAAVRAHAVGPGLTAGPIAGFVVWVAHSPLDWDWQMPAVTLIAIVLAGELLALSDSPGEAQSSSAIRGASRRKIQTASTQIPT